MKCNCLRYDCEYRHTLIKDLCPSRISPPNETNIKTCLKCNHSKGLYCNKYQQTVFKGPVTCDAWEVKQ